VGAAGGSNFDTESAFSNPVFGAMTSYGATQPTLGRGQTQALRDKVDEWKPVVQIVGCCCVVPMLATGIVLTVLSKKIPQTCNTGIDRVFTGLGVVYIVMAALAGCGFACLGSKVIDLVKHLMVKMKYEGEHRDEEAHKEEAELSDEQERLVGLACPLVCCLFLGMWVAYAFWILGIVAAAKNSHGKCGSGPTVFWVLLAVMACCNFCTVGVIRVNKQ